MDKELLLSLFEKFFKEKFHFENDLICNESTCAEPLHWLKAVVTLMHSTVYKVVNRDSEAFLNKNVVAVRQYNNTTCWAANTLLLARWHGVTGEMKEEDLLRRNCPQVSTDHAKNVLSRSNASQALKNKVANYPGTHIPLELMGECILELDKASQDILFGDKVKRTWAILNLSAFLGPADARFNMGLDLAYVDTWFNTILGRFLYAREINPNGFTLPSFAGLLKKGPVVMLMPSAIIEDPDHLENLIDSNAVDCEKMHYVTFYGLEYDLATNTVYCDYVNTLPYLGVHNGQKDYESRVYNPTMTDPPEYYRVSWNAVKKWAKHIRAFENQKYTSDNPTILDPFVVTIRNPFDLDKRNPF